MNLSSQIDRIEAATGGETIVIGASNIDIDLLPPLHDTLRRIGRTRRLNVLVYLRGGEVNAARRLALLLDEFTDHLAFIVPYHCESSGTVMALAAREVIAGATAIFSPIDPHLTASEGGAAGSPSALSSEDIRTFSDMARDWFGLEEQEARQRSLPLLCENIFPTTLTSFYRCTLELQKIGEELLALHMPAAETRTAIVRTLIHGYHSHQYALTGRELQALGLPVKRDPVVEDAAWEIASVVRRSIGPESRTPGDSTRRDAVIATRGQAVFRRRHPDHPATVWEASVAE